MLVDFLTQMLQSCRDLFCEVHVCFIGTRGPWMVIVILSIILYFTYVLAALFRSFLQVQSEQVAVKEKRGKN